MSFFALVYVTANHLSSSVQAVPINLNITPIYHGDGSDLITYVPRPTTRSTNELLTTCYITYFACVWKSIHANRIPSRSKWSHAWYKMYWAGVGIFAPELILWAALSQYMQARTLQYVWYKQVTGESYRWWGKRMWDKLVDAFPKKPDVVTFVDPETVSDDMDHENKAGEKIHTEVESVCENTGSNSSDNSESSLSISEIPDPVPPQSAMRRARTCHSTSNSSPADVLFREDSPATSQDDFRKRIQIQRAGTSNTHQSIPTFRNDDEVDLSLLPMLVAQFALMGGFVLEFSHLKPGEEREWMIEAHDQQKKGTGSESKQLRLGTRAVDYKAGILEPITEKTNFITTIRGRGFLQLIRVGAFDDKESQLKIVERYKHEIHDKCKADSVSKALVCLQVFWMLMNVIAREIVGLPITLLEIHVVVQVVITVITYALWWNKPLDAQEPIVIAVKKKHILAIMRKRDKEAIAISRVNHCCELPRENGRPAETRTEDSTSGSHNKKKFDLISMAEEFEKFGRYAFLNFPQHHIPDFITEATEKEGVFESFMRGGYDICETFFDLYWHSGTEKPNFFEDGPMNTDSERPQSQSKLNHSSLHQYAVLITAFFAALDAGIHLLAWNAYFPTHLESFLWKVACLVGGGIPIFLFLNQGNQLEYYPIIMCFGPRRFAEGKYTLGRCLGDVGKAFYRIGTMAYGQEVHVKWFRKIPDWLRLCFAFLLFLGTVAYVLSSAYITVESASASNSVTAQQRFAVSQHPLLGNKTRC